VEFEEAFEEVRTSCFNLYYYWSLKKNDFNFVIHFTYLAEFTNPPACIVQLGICNY
jgi:hypothetical protein